MVMVNFLTIDHGVNSRVSWSWSVPYPPPPQIKIVARVFMFIFGLNNSIATMITIAEYLKIILHQFHEQF